MITKAQKDKMHIRMWYSVYLQLEKQNKALINNQKLSRDEMFMETRDATCDEKFNSVDNDKLVGIWEKEFSHGKRPFRFIRKRATGYGKPESIREPKVYKSC